jgi:hypothetical protein
MVDEEPHGVAEPAKAAEDDPAKAIADDPSKAITDDSAGGLAEDPANAVALPPPETEKSDKNKVESEKRKEDNARTKEPDADKSKASERLTKPQLQQRLRLNFPGLVEEIHALAVRQNQAEDQRESRLDAKAQGLLGTAGLSLTVAFTFGSLLLQHPEYISPLGTALGWVVIALYALALVFGLLASIWAVRALKVSDKYKCLSDDDVFNEAELKRIEQEADDDQMAKAWYRRFITLQHWTFWRQHFDIHEGKAKTIKCGQLFFALFLGTLLLIGCAMAVSSFIRYQTQADTPKDCPSMPTIHKATTAPDAPASQPTPAAPQPASTPSAPAQRQPPAPTTMPGSGQDVKKGFGK